MDEFIRIVRPKNKIRLDKYLYKAGIGISRSQIQKLILEGKVLLNGHSVKAHANLNKGDKVVVNYEKPTKFEILPEAIPLDVAYEDSDVIVVNKAPGIVTHPAPGHSNGTLVNALLHHCKLSCQTEHTRPGVLHRLDQDTSGVLVFAKSDIALIALARDVEKRKFKREYITFVWGKMGLSEGTIDAPIGRHTIERKQMAVTPLRSRSAITHFKAIKQFEYITYLAVKLETGRTHQIRVHLAHLNHPVVGDSTYGGRIRPPKVPLAEFNKIMKIMTRQSLHAASLAFIHPISKKEVCTTAPLPSDMQELLDYLSK